MIRDKTILKRICQEKLLQEFRQLYPNQKDNPIKHMPLFISKLKKYTSSEVILLPKDK